MLEFRWSRGVRYVPYYLIAIHEEADDECAHAQLIADRLRLRYRDKSLPASSEMTWTLSRTESWVSAWLESYFRSTSELLLDVVDEDGGTTCSVRKGTNGRDALVTGWRKSNWERTRVVGMSSSGGYEALVSAVPGNRVSLFMAVAWLQRSFNQPGIWCRQHGARRWLAREVSAPWVRLKKKMAEWRHCVVKSWNWRRWGPTV
jgi:hypothetical protein